MPIKIGATFQNKLRPSVQWGEHCHCHSNMSTWSARPRRRSWSSWSTGSSLGPSGTRSGGWGLSCWRTTLCPLLSGLGCWCSLSRSHIRQVSKMQRTECRGDTFKQVSFSIFGFRHRLRKSTVNSSTPVFNPIHQIWELVVSTPWFLINLTHINHCTLDDWQCAASWSPGNHHVEL